MAAPRSSDRNNGEFHRADPAYRRQMQVFLAITVVVGLLALLGLRAWLQRLGAGAQLGDLGSYQAWLHRLLGGLCLMLAAAAGGFSFWLRRMAQASRSERRWPPSSMRTSADVRIRYLTSADSLVGQIQAASLALGLLALALAAWGLWLFWAS